VFSGLQGLPNEAILRAHAADATPTYAQGSFVAILEFRWRETQALIVPLLAGVAQKTFGLMLLGAAVWRVGVVRDPRRYRPLLWAVCAAGAVIGLACALLLRRRDVVPRVRYDWEGDEGIVDLEPVDEAARPASMPGAPTLH
jgi:hypothetical protein